MRTVALGFKGHAWKGDRPLRDQPGLGEHLAFMGEHVRSGVFETAGPFATPEERVAGDIVGLIVFAQSDPETARRVLATEPASASGVLRWEVLTWHP
jgi:uncharacterized protein YciI